MTRAHTLPRDKGPRVVQVGADSGSDRLGPSHPRRPGALSFADSDILTDMKDDCVSRIGLGRARRPAKA